MTKKKATIDDVLEALLEFKEETNRRFERIDRRFERIDQRFDEMDRKFDLEFEKVKTLIANLAASFVRKEEVV